MLMLGAGMRRVRFLHTGVVMLGPTAEVPLAAVRQCFDANVFGLLELCQVGTAAVLCCRSCIQADTTCPLLAAMLTRVVTVVTNSFERLLHTQLCQVPCICLLAHIICRLLFQPWQHKAAGK